MRNQGSGLRGFEVPDIPCSQFEAQAPRTDGEIKRNFTKFSIDREGNIVESFEPTANIGLVAKCVSQLL